MVDILDFVDMVVEFWWLQNMIEGIALCGFVAAEFDLFFDFINGGFVDVGGSRVYNFFVEDVFIFYY